MLYSAYAYSKLSIQTKEGYASKIKIVFIVWALEYIS